MSDILLIQWPDMGGGRERMRCLKSHLGFSLGNGAVVGSSYQGIRTMRKIMQLEMWIYGDTIDFCGSLDTAFLGRGQG